MNKIVLFYGSSTGTCENLARDIAEKLNLDSSVVHPVSELNEKTVAAADTLLLGTSTWGWGDIQDDWADALPKLKAMSLSGKKIALFGCGDSSSYGDTFCDGMGITLSDFFADSVSEAHLTQSQREVLELYSGLQQNDKKLLIAYAKGLNHVK